MKIYYHSDEAFTFEFLIPTNLISMEKNSNFVTPLMDAICSSGIYFRETGDQTVLKYRKTYDLVMSLSEN